MKKTNAYFEEMLKNSMNWESWKDEQDAERKRIIETYGYGEELSAHDAKVAENPYPFTSGQHKAYRAWEYTNKSQKAVEMTDFLWDREIKDFIDTLRNAGIKKFYFTNHSTAVMENLHGFVENGCKIRGTVKVVTHGVWRDETRLGLKIIL